MLCVSVQTCRDIWVSDKKPDNLLQQYKALNHCNSILIYLRPMRHSKLRKTDSRSRYALTELKNSNSKKKISKLLLNFFLLAAGIVTILQNKLKVHSTT